jgi:hypothetical protein
MMLGIIIIVIMIINCLMLWQSSLNLSISVLIVANLALGHVI